MTYIKPELVALGPAAELIEGSSMKTGQQFDATSHKAVIPAYELDE